MKIQLYLVLFFILIFSACKMTKPTQANQEKELLKSVELFVAGFNNRDAATLMDIFHKDYQGISPITKPENLRTFIKSTIDNFEKNNYIAITQIKEIETGFDQGYVTMNWQLKSKNSTADEPDVNVERLDIWKKDRSKQWKIFRTIIYKEQTF